MLNVLPPVCPLLRPCPQAWVGWPQCVDSGGITFDIETTDQT